jgi:hypothetical protein
MKMKRYDNHQRTGHLLAFIGKKDRKDNFSIFFPVQGLEEFDSLLIVSEGFQECLTAIAASAEYTLQSISVNDVGRVRDAFPDIDDGRLLRLDLGQFIDDHGKFISNFAATVLSRFIQKKEPLLPDIRAGAIATGSNFFDREHELTLIREKVADGKSILLQSPRRYGKSSLLKYVQQNPFPGWKVCYVDLQGGKTAEDYIELIVDGLMRSKECQVCLPNDLALAEPWQQTESVRNELKRRERGKIKDDWQVYGTNLFDKAKASGDKLLLILDEFSYMLEDMIGTDGDKMVQLLMEWFSEERQKAPNISFILAGSEHLETFLKRHDIEGKIDDVEKVQLTLFDPEKIAESFILLLFAREEISVKKSEIEKMLSLMGQPIPYFLQIFVDLVSSECRRRGELNVEDLESIYYRQLLGPDSKRHFESIEQQLYRYERYKRGGSQAAREILTRLAEKDNEELSVLKTTWGERTGSAEKFAEMLDIMKDDFYLDEKEGSIYFASKLIRDWWAKHGA